MSSKDIDIKIAGNILTIKGAQEEKKIIKDRNCYTEERFYGEFQRSFTLPTSVKYR